MQVADGWITFYTPKDLVVRSSQPDAAATLAPAIRAIVRGIDPTLPVTNVRTMGDIIDLETASRAVQVRVLGAFALVAFVLAAVGIHGLLSFIVSQRAQEIGVRMALGAQPRDIATMILDNAARLGAAGLLVGVGLAYAAARSMDALLAGVAPNDPATFGAAAALVAVMLLVGTLLPTIRALRIDPISAIRTE
jgi:ABC-type antimicrobial peptide transport system permease subunit